MTPEEERLNTPVMRWCRRVSMAIAIGTAALVILGPIVYMLVIGPVFVP